MKSRGTERLQEVIADISYIAGETGFFTGDSRADVSTIIFLAEEFERLHNDIDWDQADYLSEITLFAERELNSIQENQRLSILTVGPTLLL